MHNNVIYQAPVGSTPAIVRENPASNVSPPYCGAQSREPWTDGRKVAGPNNFVQSSARLVPQEWTGPLRGSRSEAHPCELQSLLRISFASFSLTKSQGSSHFQSDCMLSLNSYPYL